MTSYIMGKSQGYPYSCLGKTLPNLVAILHLLSTVQIQAGALALAAQMHLQNHLNLQRRHERQYRDFLTVASKA